jgi:L-ascorbate metabolism protein UlaG (beta-lactamase superfamily)
MIRSAFITMLMGLAFGAPTFGQGFEIDTIPTAAGSLEIAFIGHGSLMFEHGSTVVHVDPVMRETDYRQLPAADLLLVTHRHGDHLDTAAIRTLTKAGTVVIVAPDCAGAVEGAVELANGGRRTVQGLAVEAVPAYNVVHKRDSGQPYHPKGDGNGYVITFADTRVYVAGDTENIPEMKALTDIDIAFLPMNLPYTMTPAMVADAARAFRPRMLYPYHYGSTDVSALTTLLRSESDIEVRIRRMP